MDAKKKRERQILNSVYPVDWFAEIIPSERPDFLGRRWKDGPQIGIEITEFFVSESDARLRRIQGYGDSLLQGGQHRHKADIQNLTVTEVDILKPDDTVHATGVTVILQELPSVADCARRVAEIIHSKSAKVGDAHSGLSHVNLLIHDNSHLLRDCSAEDFYHILCVPELRQALYRSPFREVIFITSLQTAKVYFRLQMTLLLSECLMYLAAANERAETQFESIILEFARYIASQTHQPVWTRRCGQTTEVIYGDSSVHFESDSPIIRMYTDYALPDDRQQVFPVDLSIEEKERFERIQEFGTANTFVGALDFPVCAEPECIDGDLG